ncbi:MAG TPA: hypothetical protein DDW27_05925 [Bacteroidales bacterium]|nr:hypothetical protein [Bacteroidales bacterium]
MKIMKKLNKLQINPERIMKHDELITFRGGDLHYQCTCWYCSGCGPVFGPAMIPEGVNPNEWAAQQGGYEWCDCIGGY